MKLKLPAEEHKFIVFILFYNHLYITFIINFDNLKEKCFNRLKTLIHSIEEELNTTTLEIDNYCCDDQITLL